MAEQPPPKVEEQTRRPSLRQRLGSKLQSLRVPNARERRHSSTQEDGTAASAERSSSGALPTVMSPRSREGALLGASPACAMQCPTYGAHRHASWHMVTLLPSMEKEHCEAHMAFLHASYRGGVFGFRRHPPASPRSRIAFWRTVPPCTRNRQHPFNL